MVSLSLSFHICIMGVEKVEQPPRVWHSCGPLLVSGPVSLGAGWLVVVGQTQGGARFSEMAGRCPGEKGSGLLFRH